MLIAQYVATQYDVYTLHLKGRLRRRGREGDWGTAPDPSQGVAPLASPLFLCRSILTSVQIAT